jgi:CheY-like chemotaxis protein
MQKTVLLVEDYEDSRIMMRHMIEQQGYSVIEAAGAYEAIDKAEQYHPDLIFMDIGLPLLDGLSTATIIKGIKKLGRVPIIVVTAYRDVNDQARDAGCSGVMYKPVEIAELKTILDFHLTGH